MDKINLNFHYRQCYALIDKDVNDIMFIARDKRKIKDGNDVYVYEYATIPITEINQFSTTNLTVDNHLYEVLPPNLPVKFYFDLEIERVDITTKDGYELVTLFLNFVNNQIFTQFNIEITNDDYCILNSCRKDKLSFHIVAQNKICFENVQAIYEFIIHLKEIFSSQDADFIKKLSWEFVNKGGIKEIRYIFDIRAYGKNQLLRMVNQSKLKYNNFMLKCDNNINLVDTLVRLYDGIGDRKIIKLNHIFSSSKNNSKKSKISNSSCKNKTDHKATNMDLQIDGRTLATKNNLSYKKLRTLPLELQFLSLIPNDNQPIGIFKMVCFAYKGAGGLEIDILKWAKLSSKFTTGRWLKGFMTFKQGAGCYNLNTLKELVKKVCPEFFDEGIRLLNEYFKPDFTGIRMVYEDCKYVSQEGTIFENNIFADEKIILLDAQLGGGKTQAIKRLEKYIKKNNRYQSNRILILSPRIAFAQAISPEFDCEYYLDEGFNVNANRICISMESMHLLHSVKPFDEIFIDECEANLSVFSSVTMKDPLGIYNLFIKLINECTNKVIFAGAFITQKTIDFIRSFNIYAVCIRNTRLPDLKTAYRIHPDLLINKLIESIKKGEKNFCVFSSLTMLNNVVGILKGSKNDMISDIINNKSLIYSSQMDGKQILTLKKIHEIWGNKQLIMTSPTITVGNSYKPEIPDFHNIFIFACPTCIVADTFQSHKRVRETIYNRLYYSLPIKSSLDSNKRFCKSILESINNYDKNNLKNNKTFLNLINETINKKEKQQYDNDVYTLKLVAGGFGVEKKTPEGLKKLHLFNLKEEMLSKCYYEDEFNKFLKLNNYIVEPYTEIELDEEQINNLNKLNKDAIYDIILYSQILLIDDNEIETLTVKQKYKQTTHLENLQIQKHYFKYLSDSLQCDDVNNFYFNQFKGSHTKQFYNNVFLEHNKTVDDILMQYNFNKNTTIENRKMLFVKMNYILKCNEFLGIESTSKRKIIPRKSIESCYEYLNNEHDSILSIFGFKNDDRDPFKLLKKLYKIWNLCTIKALKNGHKEIKEYIFDTCNTYIDENDNQILPFKSNVEQTNCPRDFSLTFTCPINESFHNNFVPFITEPIIALLPDTNELMHEVYLENRVCLLGDIKRELNDEATQKFCEYKNKQMIFSVNKLQDEIEKLKSSPSKYYDIDKVYLNNFIKNHEITYEELHNLPAKIEQVSVKIQPNLFNNKISIKKNTILNYFIPTKI